MLDNSHSVTTGYVSKPDIGPHLTEYSEEKLIFFVTILIDSWDSSYIHI